MCPPIKVEIVFITIMEDRVVVTTRRVHRSDPTPASMKVNRVLPARKPAAVTCVSNKFYPLFEVGNLMDSKWKIHTQMRLLLMNKIRHKLALPLDFYRDLRI